MDKFQQQTGITRSAEGRLEAVLSNPTSLPDNEYFKTIEISDTPFMDRQDTVRMIKIVHDSYRTIILESCPEGEKRHRALMDLQSARMFAVDSLFK